MQTATPTPTVPTPVTTNTANCVSILNKQIKVKDLKFMKQLGGVEDLLWGFGSVMQIRNGQAVTITLINADSIPYDNTTSVKSIIDQILVKYPL